MQTNKPSKEKLKMWHDDPSNWKWGMFYFNKEDKRILPPKRIAALGWTVNFGNPYSVLAFAGAMIVIILGLILLSDFFG